MWFFCMETMSTTTKIYIQYVQISVYWTSWEISILHCICTHMQIHHEDLKTMQYYHELNFKTLTFKMFSILEIVNPYL